MSKLFEANTGHLITDAIRSGNVQAKQKTGHLITDAINGYTVSYDRKPAEAPAAPAPTRAEPDKAARQARREYNAALSFRNMDPEELKGYEERYREAQAKADEAWYNDPLAPLAREEREARNAWQASIELNMAPDEIRRYEQAYKDARKKTTEAGGMGGATWYQGGAKQYAGSALTGIANFVRFVGAGTLEEQAVYRDEETAAALRALATDARETELAIEQTGRVLQKQGAAEVEASKVGRSTAGRILTDIAVQGEMMAGDALLGLVTGSSFAPLAVRSYGSAVTEALESGASQSDAALYGAAAAALEVFTEKMFDGVMHIYGGGAADDFANYTIGRMAVTPAGRKAWSLIFSAAGEGMEELVSGAASPLLQGIYNNKTVKENYASLDWEELGYDVFIGSVLGFLGGGAYIASETGQMEASKRFFQDANEYGLSFHEAAEKFKELSAADGRMEAWIEAAEALQGGLTGSEQASVSARASEIVNDPMRLALYEEEHGPVSGTKTEQVTQIIAQNSPNNSDPLVEEIRAERLAEVGGDGITGAQAEVQELLSKGSNSAINTLIRDAAYKQAFEELTGITLSGTMSEQRAAVKSYLAPQTSPSEVNTAETGSEASQVNIDNAAAENSTAYAPETDYIAEFEAQIPEGITTNAYDLAREFGLDDASLPETLYAIAKMDLSDEDVLTVYSFLHNSPGLSDSAQDIIAVFEKARAAGPVQETNPAGNTASAEADTDLSQEETERSAQEAFNRAAPVQGKPDALTGEASASDNSAPPSGGTKVSQSSVSTRAMGMDRGGENIDARTYTPQTEAEWKAEASQMLENDFEGTKARLTTNTHWSSVDEKAGQMILDRYAAEGDWDAWRAFAVIYDSFGGVETARALAARHWDRLKQKMLSDANKMLMNSKLPAETQNAMLGEVNAFGEVLEKFQMDHNKGELIDHIVALMERRGVGTLWKESRLSEKIFGMSQREFFREQLTAQDEEYLLSFAESEMNARTRDVSGEGKSFGDKLKAYQAIAHMLQIVSTNRNIVGNITHIAIDTVLTGSMAHGINALASKVTGTKNLNTRDINASLRFQEGKKAFYLAVAEIMGDVTITEGKYGSGKSAFDAQGDVVDRVLYRASQLLSVSLTATDRFFRAGSSAVMEQNLADIGVDAEKARELAQERADWQLFNNDTVEIFGKDISFTGAAQAVHNFFNLAGIGGKVVGLGRIGGYGLAEVLGMHYTKVATNIALKVVEYSPITSAVGIVQLGKCIANKGKAITTTNADGTTVTIPAVSDEMVSKACRNIAMGMTGTGLVTAAALMYLKGFIRTGNEDDEWDIENTRSVENVKGTVLNLDALSRSLFGFDEEWQDGDTMVDLNSLEPLNLFMEIGADIARQNQSSLLAKGIAWMDGSLSAIGELPVMTQISTFFKTMDRSDEESGTKRFWEACEAAAQSFATGLVPAAVRQVSTAFDPYSRSTEADSSWATTGNKVLSTLPMRGQLPEKNNVFGEAQTQPLGQRILNNLLLPNSVYSYDPDETVRALEGLYAQTGDASIYPSRKAPNSITSDHTNYQLTAEEKYSYQQTYGQAYDGLTDALTNSRAFGELTDDEKVDAIKTVKSWAAALAKAEMLEGRGADYDLPKELDDYTEAVQSGMDSGKWFGAYTQYKSLGTDMKDSQKAARMEIWYARNTTKEADLLREQFGGSSKYSDFNLMRENGINQSRALNIVDGLAGLEPLGGKERVSSLQQYRYIDQKVVDQDEKMLILKSIMTTVQDGEYKHARYDQFEACVNKGYPLSDILDAKAVYDGLDAKDENGESVSGLKKKRFFDWANATYGEKKAKDLYDAIK